MDWINFNRIDLDINDIDWNYLKSTLNNNNVYSYCVYFFSDICNDMWIAFLKNYISLLQFHLKQWSFTVDYIIILICKRKIFSHKVWVWKKWLWDKVWICRKEKIGIYNVMKDCQEVRIWKKKSWLWDKV